MSDLLALNFDSLTSPSLRLKIDRQANTAFPLEGSHPLGWGFGWYPHDHQAAIVAKDPLARDTQVLTDALTDWANFRSTVFFSKIRGAAKGYTLHETQPFTRSFAGRDWLFLHNGDLDKEKLEELHANKSRFLEPLGKTDSELAFCFLLGMIQAGSARTLSEVPPKLIHQWMKQLDALGSADIFLTDGTTVVFFSGTQSLKPLYYTRQTPPGRVKHFESEEAVLNMEGARDTFRTALIVSSCQFEGGEWTPMQPGQLLIARRAGIVWDSQAARQTPPARKFVNSNAQLVEQETPEGKKVHRVVINTRAITRTSDGKLLGYRSFELLHRTRYVYADPVEHSTHVFRLHPIEDHLQEVVEATLEVSTPGEHIQYEDVFGNQSVFFTIDRPYTELVVTARSKLKLFAAPPDDHSLSRRQSTIPLVWMPWQRQMMLSYLMPSELPESQLEELTEYAMSFVVRNDFNLLETLKDMNRQIYQDYEYVPGVTALNTTPFEVYSERKGVCQDFANLFICLARLLSIPARYRMGYIYTGANYENKIQSDASHAWVEVYLPYVGWRGFDPTNGCAVAQDHVRVASGRNYRDATPTSGTIYKGGGDETLEVEVKMKEITL